MSAAWTVPPEMLAEWRREDAPETSPARALQESQSGFGRKYWRELAPDAREYFIRRATMCIEAYENGRGVVDGLRLAPQPMVLELAVAREAAARGVSCAEIARDMKRPYNVIHFAVRGRNFAWLLDPPPVKP